MSPCLNESRNHRRFRDAFSVAWLFDTFMIEDVNDAEYCVYHNTMHACIAWKLPKYTLLPNNRERTYLAGFPYGVTLRDGVTVLPDIVV